MELSQATTKDLLFLWNKALKDKVERGIFNTGKYASIEVLLLICGIKTFSSRNNRLVITLSGKEVTTVAALRQIFIMFKLDHKEITKLTITCLNTTLPKYRGYMNSINYLTSIIDSRKELSKLRDSIEQKGS